MFKKCLSTALVLAILGTAVGVFGMTKLDWDFGKLDTTEVISKQNTFEEEISKVVFSGNNGKVQIVSEQRENVVVDFYETERTKFVLQVANGVLTIVQEIETVNWLEKTMSFFSGIHELQATVKITLPADTKIDFDWQGKNAKLSAENVDFKSVNIVSTNGDVILKNVKATSLSVQATNGDVVFSRLNAQDTKIVSTNGSISGSLEGEKKDYKLSLETRNGSVNHSNTSTGEKVFSAKTRNDDIEIYFV